MKQIGTARPREPLDAVEQCKHGAWVGDRERRAREQEDALAWREVGAPWRQRERREP